MPETRLAYLSDSGQVNQAQATPMPHQPSFEQPAHYLASTRSGAIVAAMLALTGLLASCAAPGPHGSSSSQQGSVQDRLTPLPIMDTVKVLELHGTATVQDAGRRIALKSGSSVDENQPIQVGAKSTLRLGLGKRAVFELGPNARFVVHKLPRDGAGEARATWLRLEQGYLRVAASNDREDAPIEVSFSRWAAKLEPGESFFEARNDAGAACAANGRLHLSGVPEWTPRDLNQSCAMLEQRRAPVSIALSDADWSALRARRRLQPVLAKAANVQAAHAIARTERERGAMDFSPDPSRSLKDSSSRSTRSSNRDAPLIQNIAYMPPAPGAEQVSMPAYAAPAPAPAVAIYVKEPAPAFESQPAARFESTPADASDDASDDVAADAQLETDESLAAAEPAENVAASTPAPVGEESKAVPSTPTATMSGPSSLTTASPDPEGSSLKWNPQPATIDTSVTASAAPQARNLEVAAYATEAASVPSEIPMPESAMIAPAPPVPESLPAEWIVNVASYPSDEAAQQHAQQLVAENYVASVRQETVRGRASYRVVIEGMPTEAAAQSAAAALSSRYGLQSAWVLRKH